jgi:hypothetical protein
MATGHERTKVGSALPGAASRSRLGRFRGTGSLSRRSSPRRMTLFAPAMLTAQQFLTLRFTLLKNFLA